MASDIGCNDSNCQKEVKCCNRANSSISIMEQTISASTGAFATAILMTPMDVVKIRLQQQSRPFPKGECFFYHNGLMDHMCSPCKHALPCEWYERPGNFNGTLDAFIKITRNEGIRSLWSGLSPTLVMALPATVFYFSVYDSLLIALKKRICCQKTLRPHQYSPPEWTAGAIAGATARTIAVTIVSPLEMVRTKMQSEELSYRDIGRLVRSTFAARGLSGFYLGWSATLARDIPFSAIYWGGYEYLKRIFISKWNTKETSFTISSVSGAIAGMVAAVLTTPFDVVKTRRQITLGSDSVKDRKTIITVMKELIRERGATSLFSGVIPRVLKVAPACAIMIGSYEYFKLYFQHRREKK